MEFCLEAERFVDDRLSNWYIRRNRRRFWKSEHGADKTAAYQTLYTVLLTLTKLFAPIMPFMTETMYENLAGQSGELSVHLSDFPQADEALIDLNLSEEMNSLLRIISLGSAVRNSVKIKVRQPLAKIIVQPANDAEARAVERFADQILDELNIKNVSAQPSNQSGVNLMQFEAKLLAKTMRPKLGATYNEVETALQALPAQLVAEKMRNDEPIELNGSFGTVTLAATDIGAQWKPPAGFAGVADGSTQILVDTQITEALALEGMARETVRHVQELRKKSKLEPEDRIELHLSTDSLTLEQAVQTHKVYISDETLTTNWPMQSMAGNEHKLDVDIDGHSLHIELRRIEPSRI